MMQLDSGWAQSIGQRDYQQDAVAKLVWPNGFSLFMLSDGMGGAVFGDVASKEIITGFSHWFCQSDESEIASRMMQSLLNSDAHLANLLQQNPEYQGMGGTFIATAFDGGELFWISVGDSPLWLFREGQLQRLNADHSVKAELKQLVAAGMMSVEECASHPRRNQLTSAIMGIGIEAIDANSIPLAVGDLVVLASDGIETLTEVEISEICWQMQHHDCQSLAENLIQVVEYKQKAYQDNTTVQIFRCMEKVNTVVTTE